MNVIYDDLFLKQAKKLPVVQRSKLAQLLLILQDNPYDSRLHFKKLGPPLEGQCSFRVTRDWRVIFRFIDISSVFVTRVEHRKDIYR